MAGLSLSKDTEKSAGRKEGEGGRRTPRVAAEMALHVLAYNLTRVMNIMGAYRGRITRGATQAIRSRIDRETAIPIPVGLLRKARFSRGCE